MKIDYAEWLPDSFSAGLLRLYSTTTSNSLSNGCLTSIFFAVSITFSLLNHVMLLENECEFKLIVFLILWLIKVLWKKLNYRERNTFCCWNYKSWFWGLSSVRRKLQSQYIQRASVYIFSFSIFNFSHLITRLPSRQKLQFKILDEIVTHFNMVSEQTVQLFSFTLPQIFCGIVLNFTLVYNFYTFYSVEAACAAHPTADVFINFASSRRLVVLRALH